MANGERTTIDPLGKVIFFKENICLDEDPKEPGEIFDGVAAVIGKPILMFELNEEKGKQYFYYRSVGWHRTMLVTVESKSGRWVATRCHRNPDPALISVLMKKGRQLI